MRFLLPEAPQQEEDRLSSNQSGASAMNAIRYVLLAESISPLRLHRVRGSDHDGVELTSEMKRKGDPP